MRGEEVGGIAIHLVAGLYEAGPDVILVRLRFATTAHWT
jgi:hypothetical protein